MHSWLVQVDAGLYSFLFCLLKALVSGGNEKLETNKQIECGCADSCPESTPLNLSDSERGPNDPETNYHIHQQYQCRCLHYAIRPTAPGRHSPEQECHCECIR